MNLSIRKATLSDLEAIVYMLADDSLGMKRETISHPLLSSYIEAFHAINQDPNNELMVAEFEEKIVGTFQLTVLPYLTYKGGWRAQIEDVRVDSSQRGKGIGQQMIQWAIQRSKEKGAHVLQLTSNKKRTKAIRFYQKLGFVNSHEGMKYEL